MAVMDFREGGYIFSRHKVKREFAYDSADWDGEDHGPDAGHAGVGRADGLGAKLARLTQYLGAVASVGLMVGLVAWGWQLVSRDLSGVPVIRAIEGEARTAPDEPGGQLSSRTGYAVNAVAAGQAPAPTQEVAIAPAATELSDSDLPMGALGATAREPSVALDTPVSFDGEPIMPLSDRESRALAEAAAAAEQAAAEQAVAEAAILDAPASEGPVNEVVTDENGAPADDAIMAALAEANVTAGSLAASPRPAPRPRVTQVAAPVAVATVAPPAEAAPAPVAAEQVRSVQPSSGDQLVQIGAFDSNSIAQSEWSRLAGRHGNLFSGKGQVIQQHQSNGRTFWRLRAAGFSNRSDAQEFCNALKAGGTDCIPISVQ